MERAALSRCLQRNSPELVGRGEKALIALFALILMRKCSVLIKLLLFWHPSFVYRLAVFPCFFTTMPWPKLPSLTPQRMLISSSILNNLDWSFSKMDLPEGRHEIPAIQLEVTEHLSSHIASLIKGLRLFQTFCSPDGCVIYLIDI